MSTSLSARVRAVSVTSIWLATVLNGLYLGGMIVAIGAVSPLMLAAGLIVGIVAADLLVGLIHWACDTWGGEHTDIIRAFREHHRDPDTMLDHDWVEVNGEPAVVAVMGLILLAPLAWYLAQADNTFGCACLWSFVTFAACANQVHKWAHEPEPPMIVRRLQSVGLLLSPERHDRHHRAPYTDSYCIATGWLNRPLDTIGFWRSLEWLVEATTRARARRGQGEV